MWRRSGSPAACYRAGGDGVLHVEVEAEVDHVEDAVASQRGRQPLVQAFEPQPVRLDDAPGLSEGGRLLEQRAEFSTAEQRRGAAPAARVQLPV